MIHVLVSLDTGFQREKGTNDQIAKICWIIEKAKEFQKNYTSALLTLLKHLTVWVITNCGKFFKRWEYQTTLPVSWETCVQIKNQQLELDKEQQAGSKLRKEFIKYVYCHPAYLTSVQSI